MTVAEVKNILLEHDPMLQLDELENTSPAGFVIREDQLIKICTTLKNDPTLFFDHLSCLTGLDNGPEQQTMEVIYHLYSITKEISLTLKVLLDRTHPVVASIAGLWRSADWHEREAFDLLGIDFEGHPDLRRILLPSDWDGFPLRKDYQEQEKYHGIHVVYDREDNKN